ncbi:zinc ribbon domain-containing protein [Arthrobacter sp. zg-Y820]|uniref:FmdB family zinc ribbon protein n=1 Tax=unclassified Arthrobacter TaxID=235627 RepID=UPI002542627F|nr:MULTISPECIES: FmdB family zinc ribbon protein [unclassified Arthrobacter]MCC9195862.1 FmdB family transcriptional regulator [Arthrobacter sp. zg-Y820]MDK1278722.1 zinc ribbon domain-containing protein [Arthrobacter sp. zg.Y820]MDK1359680.1 zinc ribbon domain-containing protein [Arthrobacter sp. zg-Y1219]WIB08853.1 zinc ribbon domain-containing protein [Arthrobacter sp. zg-Y820]
MPTYAYACKDCGSAFDIQQSFTDDTLTVCPSCSGNLRKKFNSVGVVFKGSGFYRTDSREAKNSVPAAPAKSDSSSGAAASPAQSSSGSSAAPTAGAASGTGSSAK